MALADVIRDLLLDSPIPPPRWLPRKDWRHRQAKAIIARRFADQPHAPLVSAHYMHEGVSALPLFGGTRVVPAGEIEAELELELSQLNPPIFQGWAIGLAVIAAIAFLAAFIGLGKRGLNPAAGLELAVLILAPVLWVAALLVVGFFEREVELQASSVAIRRWTQVWLHRPGIHLAQHLGVTAELVGRSGLRLASEGQEVLVSMAIWPPTVRDEVEATLHGWGIELERDRHRRPT